MTVTDADGRERPVRPFVDLCETREARASSRRAKASRRRPGVLEHGGLRLRAAGPLPRRRRGDLVGAGRAGAASGTASTCSSTIPTNDCRQRSGRAGDAPRGRQVGRARRRGLPPHRGGRPAVGAERAAAAARGRVRLTAGDGAGASRVIDGFADLLPRPQRMAQARRAARARQTSRPAARRVTAPVSTEAGAPSVRAKAARRTGR